MTFKALNQADDIDALLRDEQTRTQEIELERGLKIYERAIRLYYERKWDECSLVFDELFDIDEIYEDLQPLKQQQQQQQQQQQPTAPPVKSSAGLTRLRFLAYKSFALFDLDRLADQGDVSNFVRIREALENLVEALAFDDTDPVSWRRVAELARKLGYSRICRFAIESAANVEFTKLADDQSLAIPIPLQKQNPERVLAKRLKTWYVANIESVSSFSANKMPKELEHYDLFPWIAKADQPSSSIKDTFSLVVPQNANWDYIVAQIKSILDASLPPLFVRLVMQDDSASVDGAPPEVCEDQITDAEPQKSLLVSSPHTHNTHSPTQEPSTPTHNPVTTTIPKTTTSLDNSPENAIVESSPLEPIATRAARRIIQDENVEDNDSANQNSFHSFVKKIHDLFGEIGISYGLPETFLKLNTLPSTTSSSSSTNTIVSDSIPQVAETPANNNNNNNNHSNNNNTESSQLTIYETLRAFITSEFYPEAIDRFFKSPENANTNPVNANQLLLLDLSPSSQSFEWNRKLETQQLSAFLEKNLNNTLSLGQLLIEIFLSLCLPDPSITLNDASEFVSYLHCHWSAPLKLFITSIAISLESSLMASISQHTLHSSRCNEDNVDDVRYCHIAQTMFELFLDAAVEEARLSAEAEQHSSVNWQNNDQESQGDSGLESEKLSRCQRWATLSANIIDCAKRYGVKNALPELELRLIYAQIVLLRLTRADNDIVEEHLQMFKLQFSKLQSQNQTMNTNNTFKIVLPNCQSVPTISREAVNLEISKVQTIHFFSSLFESRQNLDHAKVISHLSAVLLDDYHCDETSSSSEDSTSPSQDKERLRLSMTCFIARTSVDFRLFLWNVLRDAFESEKNSSKAALCILKEFDLLTDSIRSKGPNYAPGSAVHMLLYFLGHSSKLFSQISEYIGCNEIWESISIPQCLQSLDSIIFLSKILVYYNFFEENELEVSSLHDSAQLDELLLSLKDMNVMLWSVAYLLFKRIVMSDIESNSSMAKNSLAGKFLMTIHEELGLLQICNLKDCLFLRISLREFMALDMQENENEILQCIHCLYGISIGTECFYPFNHFLVQDSSQSASGNSLNSSEDRNEKRPKSSSSNSYLKMSRANAAELVPFLLRFAKRKKFGWTMARTDQKQAYDEVCRAIGPPNTKVYSISYNKTHLELFFESDLKPTFLVNFLKRPLQLDLIQQSKAAPAFDVYYTQAELSFGQFKSRHKQMIHVLNTDELEQARQFFLYDLIYNPNRVESWFGLGQTYGELVDAMMTWSSETFNNRKEDILHNLKHCLQSCVMAISWYFSDDNSDFDIVAAVTTFCQKLYMALTSPLDSKVFSSPIPITESTRTILFKSIEKMMLLAIRLEPKICETDWSLLCFQASTMRKAKLDPAQILQMLVNAVKIEEMEKKTQTNLLFTYTGTLGPNSLIPHYKLASMAFKLWKEGKCTIDAAVKALKTSKFFASEDFLDDDDNKAKKFVDYVLAGLQNIRQADKKKWHHRPVYRVSRILLDDCNQPEQAKEALSTLFSYRASGKPLVGIWRNENERSGRHYFYASYYTIFLIHLLEKTLDFADFRLLGKRLKRSGSSFLNPRELWSIYCQSFLRSVATYYQISTQCSHQLVYEPGFDSRVDGWISGIEDGSIAVSELKTALRDLSDLKKLNTSWYDPDLFDEMTCNVFIKMYIEQFRYESEEESTISLDSISAESRQVSSSSAAAAAATANVPPHASMISIRNLITENDYVVPDDIFKGPDPSMTNLANYEQSTTKDFTVSTSEDDNLDEEDDDDDDDDQPLQEILMQEQMAQKQSRSELDRTKSTKIILRLAARFITMRPNSKAPEPFLINPKPADQLVVADALGPEKETTRGHLEAKEPDLETPAFDNEPTQFIKQDEINISK